MEKEKGKKMKIMDLNEHAPYSLYSEKVNYDGFVYVKIRMTAKGYSRNACWKAKHRWVYEKAHGEIPEGMDVIFLDGDRYNFSLDNLELVTKAEKLKLIQYGFKTNNREVTLAGLAVVRHQLEIHKLLRNKMTEKEHHAFINRESRKRCRKRNKNADNAESR